MFQSAHEAYFESRVLSADPLELVRMLYRAATNAVQDARHHLAAGEICRRSRCISRACGILTELMSSVDRERGGEIAQQLVLLYDYMQRRLVDANIRQADEPLAEVLGLLLTLEEGWAAIAKPAEMEPPAAKAWAHQVADELTTLSAGSSWSL